MRLRLKFRKEGPIRFVGHLDLMRTIQKTFRRAGIPIAYSEGFNPHQVFSFATALAVGVTSEAEYMDLKLTEDVHPEVIKVAVNAVAPPGITILEGVVLDQKEPKAMAALAAAKYQVRQISPQITETMVQGLLDQGQAIVQKKNKKGKINDFDIRPGIHELTLNGDQITMLIATGSQLNIKPEMVLSYMLNQAELEFQRSNYVFHREELYHNKDGLKSLIIPKLG